MPAVIPPAHTAAGRHDDRSDILQRRTSEQPFIFPAELRRALVTDPQRRIRHVRPVEQQPARLLKPQALLILQRSHGGDGFEFGVQIRSAHVSQFREFFDRKGAVEVRFDPVDHFGDAGSLLVQ
nr:hypothetical protein [Paenibacillus glycinis]